MIFESFLKSILFERTVCWMIPDAYSGTSRNSTGPSVEIRGSEYSLAKGPDSKAKTTYMITATAILK